MGIVRDKNTGGGNVNLAGPPEDPSNGISSTTGTLGNKIMVGGEEQEQQEHQEKQKMDEDEKKQEEEEEEEYDQFDDCDCDLDPNNRLDRIPYMRVYDEKEQVHQAGYFIPAYKVEATIVNVERDSHTSHLLSPYIYTIDVKHGPYEWTVQKRYSDFQHLDQKLTLYRTGSRLAGAFGSSGPAPPLQYEGFGDVFDMYENETLQDATKRRNENLKNQQQPKKAVVEKKHSLEPLMTTAAAPKQQQLQQQRRTSSNFDAQLAEAKKKQTRHEAAHTKIPDFPLTPDFVIGEDSITERKNELQNYLSEIVHVRAYRNYYETAQFLEVGRLSFVYNLGPKYKEGWVKRRPGGKYARSKVRNFCVTRCLAWRRSWLVIKESFLAYIDPKDEKVRDVILFDRDFKVLTHRDDSEKTEGIHKALFVSNDQRELSLKCYTEEEAVRWKKHIEDVVKTTPGGSIWLENHPNDSTYPKRESCYGHWFVDGKCFMEHAANMMEIAKEEIFITDWWLNPCIYMKRPATDDHWRLDQILKRKAMSGVRVFILVYKEVAKLMPLGSEQMEAYMTKLSPNIKVLRHPEHFTSTVVVFAHHEKVIVIDQKIAFVGGIDLCYGRWDDHDHRLTDLGGIEKCTFEGEEGFCSDVEKLRMAYIEESSAPPSPSPTRKEGDQKGGVVGASIPVPAAINGKENEAAAGLDGEEKRRGGNVVDVLQLLQKKRERMEIFAANPAWRNRVLSLREQLGKEYKEVWIGKDYGNPFNKDLPEPEKAFDDYVDRSVIPRMPWHDISSVVYGKAARDVARHFIQRWNAALHDLQMVQNSIIDHPLLVPKSYDNVGIPQMLRSMSIPCDVQVVRSSSTWSAGVKQTECSIQNAYLKIISEAKHYIYIENQFFVSLISGTEVRNKIAEALLDRIVRAHRDKETFRVYVLMPLLPAFTKESGAMQMVLHWTFASINRGKHSLLGHLEEKIGDYSNYITFCGLRTHAKMMGRLVTELVYIHSKLIIADDRVCLIGSANINDRSQMGDRDSEVAVVVEDNQFTPSTMNGEPYQSGVFAGSLRRRLFQEHLGLLHQTDEENTVIRREILDITDPASQDFFQTWNGVAKKNAEIFDQVFKCSPSDEMTTLVEWARLDGVGGLAAKDPEAASQLLAGVRGHLVTMPLKFLSKADLYKDRFTPESLMPVYIFT